MVSSGDGEVEVLEDLEGGREAKRIQFEAEGVGEIKEG